jgi:hypothetical protein
MMARTDLQVDQAKATSAAVAPAQVNPYAASAAALGLSTSDLSSVAGTRQAVIGGTTGKGTIASNVPPTVTTDPTTGVTTTINYYNDGFGGVTPGAPVVSGNSVLTKDTSTSQGAFDLLKAEFEKYGLGSLVDDIKGLIQSGASGGTMTLALQNTDAYKKRFSANADRIAKGLTALTPAQYLAAEDSYQNIMRNYGLPASYYAKDSTGKQSGFDQLLSNDVSAVELEDRVATAQNRVVNANPDVTKALKAFYPDITNGDILAYTLDPTKALDMIKRKVTAAEIGGAALSSGLTTEATAAENLARYGVTAAQARQGYSTISEMLPRASTLSDIYNQGPYNQATAEADVFNTAGNAEATAKRKKLTALEQATFSGSSGGASTALNRDRAMSPMMLGVPGAGAF